MIVSHKHKFIFIKTVKTAGTGIECWLNPYLGKQDVATPIFPAVKGHFARNFRGLVKVDGGVRNLISDSTFFKRFLKLQKYQNHMIASDVRKNLGEEIWNSYFKFCVERNPWDKVVSLYFMIRKRDDIDLSFEEFLHLPELNAAQNFQRYTDLNGRLLVDQVVKFESLANELDSLGPKLGVLKPFSQQEKIKANYGRNGSSYREMFADESMKMIERKFSKEIELWGYSF